MFLTQTLRVRNIQEFTDFQMITLFLGKNLVRKRQELTYFHTENKSIPVPFFKTICKDEMYRNWYTLEEIILLSIWGMAYFQILNQSVPVLSFKIILFHETYRN